MIGLPAAPAPLIRTRTSLSILWAWGSDWQSIRQLERYYGWSQA